MKTEYKGHEIPICPHCGAIQGPEPIQDYFIPETVNEQDKCWSCDKIIFFRRNGDIYTVSNE
jgi:hypothetical protein